MVGYVGLCNVELRESNNVGLRRYLFDNIGNIHVREDHR